MQGLTGSFGREQESPGRSSFTNIMDVGTTNQVTL